MKLQRDLVLDVLKAQAQAGFELTAREIYNELDRKEQYRFKRGADEISKKLCELRATGAVENGISNIINGRTVLTWRLTNAQQLPQTVALDVDHRQEPAQQHTQDTVEAIAAENNLDALEAVNAPSLQEAEPSPALEHDSQASIKSVETEAEFLADLEQGIALFIQAYKTCLQERDQALSKTPAVANKPEKIGLLNLLKQHYGFINSDFEAVLTDIIADIEQLEAA